MTKTAGCKGKAIAPWLHILFFGVVALCAIAFSLPQRWAAVIVVVYFVGVTFASPMNGITFLFLCVPFFLGASSRPYFVLFEIFVYILIAVGIAHWIWGGKKFRFPFKWLLAGLALSSAFSLPVDARELLYEIWAYPADDLLALWASGHVVPKIYYIRVLMNTLSGIAVFYIAYNVFAGQKPARLEKLMGVGVVMAALVSLIGVLFLYNIIPRDGLYLSLSLFGIHGGSATGFSFNRQYFAQYLIIMTPLCFHFIASRRANRPQKFLYICALFLFVFCLASSSQKSAYLALLLASVSYPLVAGFYIIRKRKEMAPLLVLSLLVLAGAVMANSFFMNNEGFKRVYHDFSNFGQEPRLVLWSAAFKMFWSSPLLGVGLGQYHNLFHQFYPLSGEEWRFYDLRSGTAHSLYAQTLAERGLAGFGFLACFVGVIFYSAWKAVREEYSAERKFVIISAAFSLGMFLFMGLFHNVAYLRSLEIYFWMLAGLLAGLTSAYLPAITIKPKTALYSAIALALGLAFQLKTINDRPVNKALGIRFYSWEKQPDGALARWMGKRAVGAMKAENGKIYLTISCPIPGVGRRNQRLTVISGAVKRELVLTDTAWHTMPIPVTGDKNGYHVVRLESSYTFNPKQSGDGQDDRDLGVYVKLTP